LGRRPNEIGFCRLRNLPSPSRQ